MRVSMASFALSVRMFTTKGGVQSIKYTYSVSHYYTRLIKNFENFQFDKFFKLLILSLFLKSCIIASFALSVQMFTTNGGVQSIKYAYSVSCYYTRFIEIIENFQK